MTPQNITPGFVEQFAMRFSRMLSGGNFALFTLFLLGFYELFMIIMAFAPTASGAMGGFLEEFRIRCFEYNPKSGWMQWNYVATMLAEPFPLAAIIYFIWRTQIREVWRTRRRAMIPLGGSALLLMALIGAGLAGVGNVEAAQKELPFPADTLRSALPMPAFTLVNQDGQTVTLADFKGRVTLVTAVYATCTTTCPMMLKGIRTVLDELTPTERAKLSVVAFSLSPETDTKELRTMITKSYGFDSAQFNFLNGDPDVMNALLTQLNIARTRDPQTGELVHSAMFILLDREGRIAYRLSLSQRESSWLITAVRTLLAEKPQ